MKFLSLLPILFFGLSSCSEFISDNEFKASERRHEETICVFDFSPKLIYKPDQRIDSLYSEIFQFDYEGRLIVQFIIDEGGNVKDPGIIRGLTNEINAGLISIVKEFEFEPAQQNGEFVAVKYVYPFKVRLDK